VSARLLLLGKPDCHLCHEMEAVAAGVAASRGLILEKADVRSRPEWKRYALDIPVLLLEDGREVARHRATAADLAARLDALAG
jgi:hypothetical protein